MAAGDGNEPDAALPGDFLDQADIPAEVKRGHLDHSPHTGLVRLAHGRHRLFQQALTVDKFRVRVTQSGSVGADMLVRQGKAQCRRIHWPQHGIHGWHSTLSSVSALACRLRDEDWDAPCGPRLVLCVRRIGHDGEIPEPCALGLVLDLADPHRLHRGVIADLNGRVGAQVVYPDRVLRRPAHRPDEDVIGTVLDAHQRGLADRTGLIAGVGHDDHGQPGVAERGAIGPTTALVELDLVAYPLSGAGNVLRHGALLDTENVRSACHDQLKSWLSLSYRQRHDTSRKRPRSPPRDAALPPYTARAFVSRDCGVV